MTLLPPDAEARRRALSPERSFCVQAPAGSGKTELLTQRLLKLLSVCAQPEEILAITFTRKAAGEMQERLLHSLQQARDSDSGSEVALSAHKRHTRELARAALAQDAKQGWNLLDNPQRLRLCTIDSFTSYLTARLPFTANFGARPELTTDTSAILQQAARATLQSLNEESACAEAVATLLQHLHNNLGRAEGLLIALLEKRSDWLPVLVPLGGNPAAARRWLEQNLESLLQELLEGISTQLKPFQHRLLPLLQYADENRSAQGNTALNALASANGLPAARPAALALWEQLGDFLLTGTGEFRKAGGLQERSGFSSPSKIKDPALKQRAQEMKNEFGALVDEMAQAGLLPACQQLKCLPPQTYEEQSWHVVDAILQLLPVLAAQLHVAMRSANKIDHTETSLAALMALGSDDAPTDLALRLDYKLRHILVDEFQDTSHIQFRLLEKLTAGWQPGDGRTLFIVGDGMQSCYGFRNADVSLFLRARNSGIGQVKLEALELSVNFRSTPAIVQWVNEVFSQAFPAEDDVVRGGVKYSPSTASRSAGDNTGSVHCRLLVKQTADGESEGAEAPDNAALRRDEANAVAALCAELRQRHAGDSIAILVRNRSHLSEVVIALRERQISWNASEIDPLLSYSVIADLFTLLRALLNLGDVTAWLALLRSPGVGLGLADMELLSQKAKQQQCTLWRVLHDYGDQNLSEDARMRLQRCVPVLQNARRLRQQMPLRDWLEMTWLDLGGAAAVTDPGMLPNVTAFLSRVEQYAEHGDIVDIHDFEERLNASYGSAQANDVKLEIMTIHKAKGLEFDHVILCGLDRKPRNSDAPLLRWRDFPDAHAGSRVLLGLTHKRGEEEDALYRFLKQEEDARQRYEITRLLYIGVTRAAKSAWLFATVSESSTRAADVSYKVDSKSLLHSVLPVLIADQQKHGVTLVLPAAAPVPAATGSRFAPQQLRRLPMQWQSPLPAPLLAGGSETAVGYADEYDNLPARTFGNLVHLGLKLLVEQGAAALERALELPWWRLQLTALHPDPQSLESALAQLREQLLVTSRSAQLQWLFGDQHQQDACELELFDYRSNLRRYVVDRTFVDADGARWIIDYKTAVPANAQTLAAFLEVQVSRYRSQLETYAALLDAMHGQRGSRCRLALYFTGLGLLHELPSLQAKLPADRRESSKFVDFPGGPD